MELIDPGLKGVINFFVPAVYLREKIQTDSFGMDITDILCIVGLLVEVKHNKTPVPWVFFMQSGGLY